MLKSGKQKAFWFPDQVSYEIQSKGEIGYREVLKVIHCNFQTKPDLDDFQISSLKLPQGRRVLKDNRIQMLVDNNKIRQATESD
tara:strand:- start:31768 stop:32019 length:252 start_codon:yes stop_codon:yes gene_type:complete